MSAPEEPGNRNPSQERFWNVFFTRVVSLTVYVIILNFRHPLNLKQDNTEKQDNTVKPKLDDVWTSSGARFTVSALLKEN